MFLIACGALLLLQSRWTKQQLVHILQEVALQAGIKLSIEEIKGELPLKWSLSNIRLALPEGDLIEIDQLRLRLALLPLLRGQLGASYLHANHTTIFFTPRPSQEKPSHLVLPRSFFLRAASFDQITFVNQKTHEHMDYSLKGRGRFSKKTKSFFVEAMIHSKELDATVSCSGSQAADQIEADLKLKVRSQDAFKPFYAFPAETAFDLQTHASGPWITWESLLLSSPPQISDRPISGTIELSAAKLPLPFHLSSLQTFSHFSLSADRSWSLHHLSLQSNLIEVEGSAEFSSRGIPTSLHTHLSLPDLSRFSPRLKGQASGKLDLQGNKLDFSMATPELIFDQIAFAQGEIVMASEAEKDVWNGSVQMAINHPTLGGHASAHVHWTPERSIELKDLDLTALFGQAAGDLSLSLQDMKTITGGISFQITDLSLLSQLASTELAGKLGGSLQFEGSECSCHAIGKHLKVNQFLSTRVDLDLAHVKLPLQGSLKLSSGEAYLRDIYLSSFTYEMGWNTVNWNYALQASGDWKGPFEITSQGKLTLLPNQFELFCDELHGRVLEKQLLLRRPFYCGLSHESFKLEQLDLTINEGALKLSSAWTPSKGSLKLDATHFPLDFLTLFSPRFSLSGLSSLDIDLDAASDQLTGHLNLLLEHADIYASGSNQPIQTKGNIQAHLANGTLQLHTHLVATDHQLCEISATLPVSFHLEPLHLKFDPDRPLAGQCTIEGHAEQLFDFINLGSQRIGGFLSCRLLLSGTSSEPILHGPLSIQKGLYENFFIGIAVKEADVTAEAVGRKIVVEKAHATDGEKGTSESTAVFHLTKGLPFSIQGTIHHFRVIRFDWLTGACSGPFTIEGNLDQALAKGKLELDEANVYIPDQLPSDLPALPVTFINQPPSHLQRLTYTEPYPFYYDLDIHGDHDLRLEGRGINAELEGDIHMTGKNLSVIASGTLHTKKGKFSFAGKDFLITQGELIFSEESSFLNITSSVELPALTVTVHFRGALKSPQLIFESNPSMPTSSILARILFNKDVSELSATQALQLANTIVTLSGGSAPNVLESIRKNLGIDRLSISASEETGLVSVQIGKYLTKGVMISLTQSTESSLVKVEVELKGGFVLEAETQEDNQGKFSFKWNKNY